MAKLEQIGETSIVDEPDLELKVIPSSCNIFTVQIGSDDIRGTLVMREGIEKEDLMEIVDLLFNIIEDISLAIPNDQSSQ